MKSYTLKWKGGRGEGLVLGVWGTTVEHRLRQLRKLCKSIDLGAVILNHIKASAASCILPSKPTSFAECFDSSEMADEASKKCCT